MNNNIAKHTSPLSGEGQGGEAVGSEARLQYIDLYTSQRNAINAHSCEVMNAHRDAAFEAFKAVGFANRKVEEYKYTNMQELFAPDLGVNINRLEVPVNPYDAFKCDVPNLSTQLYFVVNDSFYDKALPKAELPEGVIVGSLCKEAQKHPELIRKYYNQASPPCPSPERGENTLADTSSKETPNGTKHTSPLSGEGQGGEAVRGLYGEVLLNTMLAQDGLLIYVPKGVKVDKTIQVINILRSDVPMMVNRRVLIITEANASVKVLFCDHAADDREFLTTQVSEIFVGEGANVEVYGLEETHQRNTLVDSTFIEQQRDSHLRHDLITLHNGTTRHTTKLRFAGEGAECYLDGAVIADKQQHVDNNTLIDHAVPHCDSHELYKYVLDENAVGAFAGKVLVRKDAQKTTSQETNQNLLATKQARMYTQPMLEIYADDVKCSHGSTVGQLNDKALFYMQQRGIPLKEARMLLQTAFITEVIDNIPLEPLRDRLHYLVDKRFRGELSKCTGCKLCK